MKGERYRVKGFEDNCKLVIVNFKYSKTKIENHLYNLIVTIILMGEKPATCHSPLITHLYFLVKGEGSYTGLVTFATAI